MFNYKRLLSVSLLVLAMPFCANAKDIDLKNFELVDAAPAKVVPAADVFKYKAGDTLENVMHLWALQSGWASFYWKFPSDFPDIVFQEDFTSDLSTKTDLVQAYTKILKALNIYDRVTVTFYNGNKTIVVSPKQN